MKIKVISNHDSVLSYKHLVRIGAWAKTLSEDENRIWTKADSKIALRILMEQKRIKNLEYKQYEKKLESRKKMFKL